MSTPDEVARAIERCERDMVAARFRAPNDVTVNAEHLRTLIAAAKGADAKDALIAKTAADMEKWFSDRPDEWKMREWIRDLNKATAGDSVQNAIRSRHDTT